MPEAIAIGSDVICATVTYLAPLAPSIAPSIPIKLMLSTVSYILGMPLLRAQSRYLSSLVSKDLITYLTACNPVEAAPIYCLGSRFQLSPVSCHGRDSN